MQNRAIKKNWHSPKGHSDELQINIHHKDIRTMQQPLLDGSSKETEVLDMAPIQHADGLTSSEAAIRLEQYGYNELQEEEVNVSLKTT